MLNILQIIFSLITAALAVYSLLTGNFEFQAYMNLFLGLTLLVVGLKEFRKNKKTAGWLMVGMFVLFLALFIQRLILF